MSEVFKIELKLTQFCKLIFSISEIRIYIISCNMQNLQHNAYVDIISLVVLSKMFYPYMCVSSREGYSLYIENRFQFSKSALEFPIIFLYSRIYWLLWCQISRKRLSWSIWAHVFLTYATCRFLLHTWNTFRYYSELISTHCYKWGIAVLGKLEKWC